MGNNDESRTTWIGSVVRIYTSILGTVWGSVRGPPGEVTAIATFFVVLIMPPVVAWAAVYWLFSIGDSSLAAIAAVLTCVTISAPVSIGTVEYWVERGVL